MVVERLRGRREFSREPFADLEPDVRGDRVAVVSRPDQEGERGQSRAAVFAHRDRVEAEIKAMLVAANERIRAVESADADSAVGQRQAITARFDLYQHMSKLHELEPLARRSRLRVTRVRGRPAASALVPAGVLVEPIPRELLVTADVLEDGEAAMKAKTQRPGDRGRGATGATSVRSAREQAQESLGCEC